MLLDAIGTAAHEPRSPLENKMQAAILRSPGRDIPFELVDMRIPDPGEGEVLMRVEAAGINPADVKMRSNGGALLPPSPSILGIDAAGVIVGVGAGVSDLKLGDRVFGVTGGVGMRQGALAEFQVVEARRLALAPRSIPLDQAASLPLVAITAWEGLFDRAGLRQGQSIAILGASGAVGSIATQLANVAGANILAVVSDAKKAARAIELGAQAAILREDIRHSKWCDRFDVVFDASGYGQFDLAFSIAKPQAQIVSIVTRGAVDLTPAHNKGLGLHAVMMLVPLVHEVGVSRHAQILREVAALVDAGKLRVRLDPRRFGLKDLEEAFESVERGGADGKIVVRVARP